MAMTREEVMAMEPYGVLDMDSSALDTALTGLEITIGTNWSKSRKAPELSRAIKQLALNAQLEQPS